MISKRELNSRIESLEHDRHIHIVPLGPTLSVPVVDENGERVMEYHDGYCLNGGMLPNHKEISFSEVCQALQDMCGIEITYQEVGDKSGVVIYEKEDD